MHPEPAPVDADTSFRHYFSKIFEHDRWANGVVLEAMTELGDQLPPKPLDRLSHLIICQQLWLSRFTDDAETPDDIFPKWPLDGTKRQVESISTLMKRCLETMPEADFHRHFDFTTLEGAPMRLRRRDIFTQLGQHGAYHRGQIAMELNPLRDESLTTDYVYYTWERQ